MQCRSTAARNPECPHDCWWVVEAESEMGSGSGQNCNWNHSSSTKFWPHGVIPGDCWTDLECREVWALCAPKDVPVLQSGWRAMGTVVAEDHPGELEENEQVFSFSSDAFTSITLSRCCYVCASTDALSMQGGWWGSDRTGLWYQGRALSSESCRWAQKRQKKRQQQQSCQPVRAQPSHKTRSKMVKAEWPKKLCLKLLCSAWQLWTRPALME